MVMFKLEKDVELVLRDFLPPLAVVVVDQAPAHQVPVVLDVLHQLLELARLHGEEDDQGRGEEEGGVVALLQEEEKVVVHLAEQTKGEAEDEEEGVTMAGVGRGWCHRTSLSPIFLLTKCRGDCMMARWLRAS